MSGYRVHSFDPNAYEQPGPPLKPYNWVQWTGIGIGCVGAALIAIELLGRFGVIPRWVDDFSAMPFMLLVIGMTLVNSRRAPGTEIGPEQRAKTKRTLLVTAAICAVILGAVVAIEFSGAAG